MNKQLQNFQRAQNVDSELVHALRNPVADPFKREPTKEVKMMMIGAVIPHTFVKSQGSLVCPGCHIGKLFFTLTPGRTLSLLCDTECGRFTLFDFNPKS